LLQVTDENALAQWAQEAIDSQPQAAQDVREGKDAAIGRLIGEAMKRSGGSADAGAVRSQLLAILRP
jgi:aspartyl-tRNA(Asn)/glutamyl-tRNA(Gln) amidotransferase subunit B